MGSGESVSLLCSQQATRVYGMSLSFSAKKDLFQMMRKMHYNEGQNIKLARELIAKDLEEDEDEEMGDETEETEEISVDPPQEGEHLQLHSVLNVKMRINVQQTQLPRTSMLIYEAFFFGLFSSWFSGLVDEITNQVSAMCPGLRLRRTVPVCCVL